MMKNRTEELEDLKELRLAAAEALQLLQDMLRSPSVTTEELSLSIRRLQAILNVYIRLRKDFNWLMKPSPPSKKPWHSQSRSLWLG